jgi:catechol 2,3-dioxygenase-like lactoylglutathione lyase family enzyme
VGPSVPADSRAEPVALRVSDLAASREFFQELFGLQPAYGSLDSHASVVLTSPVPGHPHFALRLTTDPVPVRLAGVHVELETTNELLDLYFLSLLNGHKTSELRFRRGSLATTITDPDGYFIEVEAHYGSSATGADPVLHPRRLDREIPGRCAGEPQWHDGGATRQPRRGVGEPGRSSSNEFRACAPQRLAR